MSLGDILLPFLILLGVLIFIHELGHFLVAKWCGVKVEKFSLGFGPVLLRKRIGETEYAISALPLGGFVKMLGELPGEELPEQERDRAFNFKPPWQRIAIAFAGPLMNFLLPVFLLAGILMFVGLETVTSHVGGVAPGTPAERAALRPGDRIVAVDGDAVEYFHEIISATQANERPQVDLTVERAGQRLELPVVRERDPETGELGNLGIHAEVPAALIAVQAGSDAAAAGLETGDRVVRVGDEAVRNEFELRAALAQASAPIEVEVERPMGEGTEQRYVSLAAAGEMEDLGLHLVDFVVHNVSPTTPAREAGIREGDIFLMLNGEPVTSRDRLVELIRGSGGGPIQARLLRGTDTVEVELTPIRTPMPGADGEFESHYAIGVVLGPVPVGRERVFLPVRNPLEALRMGVQQTVAMTGTMLQSIAAMFTGKVGMGGVAGPIGIAEVAADAFGSSWTRFVELMAFISINLAILNLLPVPVLDGGTIVLTTAEWARGGPLSDRTRDFAQAVGLSLILLLMGFAFWNDLARN
jgi:regulator of sigma E protease